MIVCGGHSRKRCPCGRRADRLCDWKVEGKRSGTCDSPICSGCSTSPAPGKDLCAKHAVALEEWRTGKRAQDQQKEQVA
ncbi:hypothetical protein [Sphingomonas sp. Leaf343]|uniref:hypothetical protein n=1 Tax=Sphingomonas sp. Leaf343 TaxID=1736345 RepID=UPI0006FDFC7C|nr:hypothetical protein [Sphingomonas sp. Leaf343]KQR83485.1 hypothetical protein ASG07_07090 [Sphingomonas sp. Leaf343]